MNTVLVILGGLGVLSGVIVWAGKNLFKKYVLPLIKTKEQKELAEHIGNIADEVTDNLVEMFPDAKWDDILNKAVDEIIKIVHDKNIPESNIKPAIAKRAAGAAIQRKRNSAIAVRKKELLESMKQ